MRGKGKRESIRWDRPPAAQDRLFGDYAVEWYNVRKAPYIRPGTQKTYRSMLNKHFLPAFGDCKLRSIQPLEFQFFPQQFANMSWTHINTLKFILKDIFTSACRDRILENNPAQYLTNPPISKPAEKPTLSTAERRAIENTCATHQAVRSWPYSTIWACASAKRSHSSGVTSTGERGLSTSNASWTTMLLAAH